MGERLPGKEWERGFPARIRSMSLRKGWERGVSLWDRNMISMMYSVLRMARQSRVLLTLLNLSRTSINILHG